MVRMGVIGSGGMAGQRADTFAALGTRVAAVHGRSAERARPLCDRSGAVFCADVAGLWPLVDAVVVCAPNALHAPLAVEALRQGKHVLVEYPLCVSLDEKAALEAEARRAGRVLMTGNTIMHEAMFRFLWERKSRLGSLVSAASRVAWYAAGVAEMWYMRPEIRGPLFAAFHYHHIEYYRHFLGEVKWVSAHDESRPDPARPGVLALSGGTLVMGHETGATSCVQWYLGSSGNGLPRAMALNGAAGSVTVVSRQGQAESDVIWDDGGEGKVESFANEWGVEGSSRDFLAAIEGRLDAGERLAWDAGTLRVGLAAGQAAAMGGFARV